MGEKSAAKGQDVIRSVGGVEPVVMNWGQLNWLVGEELMPGSEQTLGVVTIHPGKRNPLHLHPNCEELLYVIQGTADHKLGEEMFEISAGDVIRIPRGIPHWAQAKGDEPLVAVISFSAADRKTENLEDSTDLA